MQFRAIIPAGAARRTTWLRAALVSLSFVATVLLLVPAPAAFGQSQSSHWFGMGIGGGLSPTVGDISNKLNTGGHFTVGAGLNPTLNWNGHSIGLVGQFMYNWFGVNSSVLRSLSVPQGNAHMWSLTADPMWRFAHVGPVGAYVIGGVGFYRRTVQFTKPTTTEVTIFNPWWGYLGPFTVPTNQVLGSVTENAPGVNGGLGLDWDVGHGGTELYVEVRYHYIHTSPAATEILPITFGVRW